MGRALSFGWAKFRSNLGPWIGVTAVGLLIYLACLLVVQIAKPRTMLAVLFVFLMVMAAVWLLQAAMIRGALYETDDSPPPFGAYLRGVNVGNVLLTALLAFALMVLGFSLIVVPGVLAGWLSMFALHFVIDRDQGPIEALKSSWTLVLSHAGPTALLALTVAAVTILGLLTCGLGLLVAGPVTAIAVTRAYRLLTGDHRTEDSVHM